MRAYDIALFVHLLGLITLFGGFAISARAGARLRAAADLAESRTWLGLLASIQSMFTAGLGLLLASGLYMTFDEWDCCDPGSLSRSRGRRSSPPWEAA